MQADFDVNGHFSCHKSASFPLILLNEPPAIALHQS